mgnify:CR=1 FL=1
MLKSNNVINTTNLEKEDDADPYFDEKIISTDPLNSMTRKLDSLENENKSYVLGYN